MDSFLRFFNWFMPSSPYATDSDPSANPLAKYEVRERLGAGGYATVHDGIRIQDGQRVALKFMNKDLHAKQKEAELEMSRHLMKVFVHEL